MARVGIPHTAAELLNYLRAAVEETRPDDLGARVRVDQEGVLVFAVAPPVVVGVDLQPDLRVNARREREILVVGVPVRIYAGRDWLRRIADW